MGGMEVRVLLGFPPFSMYIVRIEKKYERQCRQTKDKRKITYLLKMENEWMDDD